MEFRDQQVKSQGFDLLLLFQDQTQQNSHHDEQAYAQE